MFRVLHIMGCSDIGGVSTVVLNYYRHMDRDCFQFDVAFTSDILGKSAEEFKAMGAEIFTMPKKSKGIRVYEEALENILNNNDYDAIHVHENFTSYIALRVAKKCGISKRIAHSHCGWHFLNISGMLRQYSGRILNSYYATDVIGCGKLAGETVFGKRRMEKPNAHIVPNAIDTSLFLFNESIRKEKRQLLGLEKSYVIGMVGRLSEEKNHTFAISLMEQLRDIIPEAVLLLIGDGEERDAICNHIEQCGLQDRVIVLGNRPDVPELDQVIDVAVLPSLNEGFPVAAVEYMAAGLPLLVSNTITDELAFGADVEYLPLDDQEQWLKALCKYRHDEKRSSRSSHLDEHGLDISFAAKKLESIYRG